MYQEEWQIFRASLASLSEPSKTSAPKAPKAKKAIGGLVAALRFRQKSSLLRIQSTVDFAVELLEQGIKPAISCAFVESMRAIETALVAKKKRCAIIYGGQSAAVRETERLKFQQGGADVVLFTIEEGISLHQGEYEDVPRSLLIHDLRWSAIAMAQIEGRTHRNGQFAQAYWLIGEDTIEGRIAERVAKRTVAMKALSGETDSTLDDDILQVLLAM